MSLSFNFRITIYFDQTRTLILYHQIKYTILRLKVIDIALIEFIESVNIACLGIKQGRGKGMWVGIIKVHLLKSEIDAIALCEGLRRLNLIFDDMQMIGKVCKRFHNISSNSKLSVKIMSDFLKGFFAPSVSRKSSGVTMREAACCKQGSLKRQRWWNNVQW